ncbi:MAG: hypothetical protein NTX28_05965 [Novosphingobium sp.]|nr:hypothetical protein [Novosphingobium sp.]
MIDFHSVFLRCAFATLTLAATSGCNTKPFPAVLEKYCVSDSGLSKYWLMLNVAERRGTIRYQYRGQDIRFDIKIMQVDGREVRGRADFESSTTGETHGNPILFRYDDATVTLTDGAAAAACQNIEETDKG